jgi:hypothetical protein
MHLLREFFKGSALLLLAYGLTACGGAQYNVQGMSNGSYLEGSVKVNTGCYGGSDTLTYSGKTYTISGNSSASVLSTLDQLGNGGVGVLAFSTDYCSKTYRAWFLGTFSRGPCTTNPTATCNLVTLTALQAF